MDMKRLWRRTGPVGSLLALGAFASAALAQEVVMSGLDNPRGLAFAANGALYVAEAGRGGAGPCVTNPGSGEVRCYGTSGAVSRLWKGEQSRVVQGLPSHAMPDGSSAGGPNDIAMLGNGGAYVTLGLGGGPEFRAALGCEPCGSLIQMAPSGQWRVVADVAAFEFANNPAGGPVDSNPFGLHVEAGGVFLADAGANVLYRVSASGAIETVSQFPSLQNPTPAGPPMVEPVPTSVTRASDGTLYVGQLTGFPFVQGLANIYRVVPGDDPVLHCSGFKMIIDIAAGPDDSLYVVENATSAPPPAFPLPPFPPLSGKLTRVGPNCEKTTILTALDRPTSVTVGPDGAVYVTNHGVTPGAGQVLRVTAP
jgi:hypothetical protein